MTFKSDGALGGAFGPDISSNADGPPDIGYGRFAFDNFYNFFIAMLVVELFAGIIIDSFAELRQADEEREADLNAECFICG